MANYRLASKNVSGEIIDDELIIVDLASGAYFNSTGSALLLWRAIASGLDVDAAIGELSARAADPAQFSAAAQEWVGGLVTHGILVPDDDGASASHAPLFADTDISGLEPPVLERHGDMEDLLLFDPVHDFDDLGWPKQPVR